MSKSENRSEQAYSAIKTGILSGEFAPGSRLREECLATVVGFSRTPVRDALRRLQADGMIEYKEGRGLVVSALTPRDLEDLFDLRILVEGFGAARAALRCDETQIAALQDLADKMTATLEDHSSDWTNKEAVGKITRLNSEFHGSIAHYWGTRRLPNILASLVDMQLVLRTYSGYGLEQLRQSMSGHHELVAALRARDPEWARAVMTAHLSTAKHSLLKVLDRSALHEAGRTRKASARERVETP